MDRMTSHWGEGRHRADCRTTTLRDDRNVTVVPMAYQVRDSFAVWRTADGSGSFTVLLPHSSCARFRVLVAADLICCPRTIPLCVCACVCPSL